MFECFALPLAMGTSVACAHTILQYFTWCLGNVFVSSSRIVPIIKENVTAIGTAGIQTISLLIQLSLMDEFLVYRMEAIELGYSSVRRLFAQHV